MNEFPFDATNSSNPWLMKCVGDPITGPTGDLLSPDYIWSLKGNERVLLVEWLLKYYRDKGYPYFHATDDELKSDFAALAKKDPKDVVSDGVIKNSATVGSKIAKHFTDDLFSCTRGRKQMSCVEAFNDDETLRFVLKNRMGWNTTTEGGSLRPYVFGINDKMICQGLRSSAKGFVTSNFKPLIAKYVYDKYNVKKTIDYSCGWGARCAAALSLGIEYYGIDPLTFERINKIINYFGGKGFAVGKASENFEYSWFPEVDMAMSCPPYTDYEIYSMDERQSSSYVEYNDWLTKYWQETVKRCYEKCKYFAFIAVENVGKHELLEDMRNICSREGGKVIEDTLISVSRGHLSGKAKTKQVCKKTEHLMVLEVK